MINDKLQHFTSTSKDLYDRHKYKIVFKNGKSITVDDYGTMKNMWYQMREHVSNVEIIDDKPKKKGGGGF